MVLTELYVSTLSWESADSSTNRRKGKWLQNWRKFKIYRIPTPLDGRSCDGSMFLNWKLTKLLLFLCAVVYAKFLRSPAVATSSIIQLFAVYALYMIRLTLSLKVKCFMADLGTDWHFSLCYSAGYSSFLNIKCMFCSFFKVQPCIKPHSQYFSITVDLAAWNICKGGWTIHGFCQSSPHTHHAYSGSEPQHRVFSGFIIVRIPPALQPAQQFVCDQGGRYHTKTPLTSDYFHDSLISFCNLCSSSYRPVTYL